VVHQGAGRNDNADRDWNVLLPYPRPVIYFVPWHALAYRLPFGEAVRLSYTRGCALFRSTPVQKFLLGIIAYTRVRCFVKGRVYLSLRSTGMGEQAGDSALARPAQERGLRPESTIGQPLDGGQSRAGHLPMDTNNELFSVSKAAARAHISPGSAATVSALQRRLEHTATASGRPDLPSSDGRASCDFHDAVRLTAYPVAESSLSQALTRRNVTDREAFWHQNLAQHADWQQNVSYSHLFCMSFWKHIALFASQFRSSHPSVLTFYRPNCTRMLLCSSPRVTLK